MFQKILVPLDGSVLAEKALPLASAIARVHGSTLCLARIVPYFAVLAADPLLYDEVNRLSEEDALGYLHHVEQALPSDVPTEVVAEIGSAAEGVLDLSKKRRADLIVLCSHGRSGMSRLVFGSVAERILSQADVPTVIINARCEPWDESSKRILVPLDGSQLAEQALGPARALADALPAQLHLLNAVTSAHIRLETPSMAAVFADLEEREMDEAKAYLSEQAELTGLDGVMTAVELAADGAAEAITSYASREKIDMIVMSSHGRSGISRWVYGSVAEKVLRSACCATLVVRHGLTEA